MEKDELSKVDMEEYAKLINELIARVIKKNETVKTKEEEINNFFACY